MPDPAKGDSLPDQDVRRPDHWTVLENFETHAVGVLKPGQYRAKNLKHEPGVYEMTDLVPVAERDRLRAENEALKARYCQNCEDDLIDRPDIRAENERLREDAFTPDEIKLMAREISGMCDNAADGGSIPPVPWRQLANKLDRLARTSDEEEATGV